MLVYKIHQQSGTLKTEIQLNVFLLFKPINSRIVFINYNLKESPCFGKS